MADTRQNLSRAALRAWIGITALIVAGCSEPPTDPVAEGAWVAPRTPWGEPDLRGVWPLDYINGTPVQRPESFGARRFLTDAEYAERVARLNELNGRYDNEIATNKMGMGHWAEMGEPNRLTSLVAVPENGRVPDMTTEGLTRSAQMRSSWSDIPFDSIADFNALDRCITRGLPASMFPFMYNAGIEIRQAPGIVVLRLEIVHESRIVYLDDRPAPGAGIQTWMGESRGYWEGNTLVIETTHFNGESPMLIVGPGSIPIPTSEALSITERLTRTDADTIEYSITVRDPLVLSGPWTAAYPWRRDDDFRFFEYACHEDNRTIRDFITTSRYERANRP